jgi:hypothetical protein
MDLFDRVIAHLHQTPLNAIAFWNLQQTASLMMHITHHCSEFRLFHLVKWLVTGDDPFHEKLLERLLVKWPLS